MADTDNRALHRPAARLLLSTAVTVVVFLLRQLLLRFGIDLPPFTIVFPAIVIVALFWGLWPGLLATALSAALLDYFVLPPIGQFGIASASDAIALSVFAATGIVLSVVFEQYRRNQKRIAALEHSQRLRDTEEQLQQTSEDRRMAEAKYRSLVESIPAMVWAADPNGLRLSQNRRWCEYTGQKDEEALGLGWRNVIHPDDVPRVLACWGRSRQTGEDYWVEYRVRRADAVYRWHRVHARLRRDEQGEPLGWFGASIDIDDQKRAEMRLRRFYETDLFAILYWKIDGSVVDANNRFLEMTGYSREDIHTGCLNWAEITPPEYREKDEDARRQIRETGVHLPYEKEFVRKDGTRVWGQFWAAAYEDDRTQGVSFILDISNRKRVEEELRQQAELLDLAHDTIMMCDLNGIIRFWNHGAEEMYGYTRQEATGKFVSELLRTVSPRPMPEIRAHLLNEGRWEGELAHTTREGKGIVVASRWVLQRDNEGRPCGMMEINNDITERTRADEAQRQAHHRLQSVLDSITDGMMVLDERWRFAYLNEQGAHMLGSPPEQLIGRDFWKMFPHAEETKFGESYRRAVQTRQPVHFEEFYSEPLNLWLECHCYPSADGLSVYFRDIGERKRAEQALLRSEKLASVGRMAATIAHEINNPLAAVTNLLYLVQRMQDLPEAGRQYVEAADAELKRVAHIVRQSLGFYRESNAPGIVSVNAVLDSAVDLMKAKIKEKRAIIEKQCCGEVELTALAGELRQVFSNLLGNSLDAIDEKGRIKLRISVHPDFNHGCRTVRITIADNGQGISPGSRRHVFEPFFTTKGTVGTGLGLWVSKQIVDKHHGIIRMRSSTQTGHRGTVVSVILPIGPQQL